MNNQPKLNDIKDNSKHPVVTYMIIESSCLTELFNSISHFTIISISKPDGRSAGVCFLQNNNIIINEPSRKKDSEIVTKWIGTFTVILPMISNCRPAGPTNLHITSSTVAVCTWNRSWSLGNVDSSTLISCFNTFRQAIVDYNASTSPLSLTRDDVHCSVSQLSLGFERRSSNSTGQMMGTYGLTVADERSIEPLQLLRRYRRPRTMSPWPHWTQSTVALSKERVVSERAERDPHVISPVRRTRRTEPVADRRCQEIVPDRFSAIVVAVIRYRTCPLQVFTTTILTAERILQLSLM